MHMHASNFYCIHTDLIKFWTDTFHRKIAVNKHYGMFNEAYFPPARLI